MADSHSKKHFRCNGILALCLSAAVLSQTVTAVSSWTGQTVTTVNSWTGLLGNTSDVLLRCDAFYFEYIKAVNNFTHCELKSAQPFRLCGQCIQHYTLAQAIYNDLLKDNSLDECRKRYFESDSIQIIPTVQLNMDTIWKSAACTGYAENVTLDKATATVTINKLYDDVQTFLDLHHNLSVCLNHTNMVDLRDSFDALPLNICSLCQSMYDALNKQFNSMKPHNDNLNDKDDSNNNNICMDIVDRMNHTRLTWTGILQCSPRSSDLTPVVSISCVVAVTPIFFYLLSKMTGREGFRKIYRQKRLALSRSLVVPASDSETSAIQRLSQRLPSFTR